MKKRIVQHVVDERPLPGGRRIELELLSGDERVPAVLQLPGAAAPAAAALLLHGYTSDKETMARTIGEALLGRGIASLSLDLPLHGARRVPDARPSLGGVMELVRHWRTAIAEATLGIAYLGARPEVDRERIALVGYSLGSYLSLTLAADDRRVRALVLAAGGDLPASPFAAVARTFVDPTRTVKALDGRPLLMVNGRRDHTIPPAAAERLFQAAAEPKEIRWYDAGHILPLEAARDVARWLAAAL